MFHLMDKDKNGFITVTEFWNFMVIFAKGSEEEKAKLLFKIYDLSETGSISSQDLSHLIK